MIRFSMLDQPRTRLLCRALGAAAMVSLVLSPGIVDAAQRNEPNRARAAAPQTVADPAVFRIVDVDSEVFIVSTLPALPKGVRWRSRALAGAIESAETLWFEAETDTPEARATAARILMSEGFLKESESLAQRLGEADAARLAEIAQAVSLPMEALDRMRPWHAHLILKVQALAHRGETPGAGIDGAILKEARARGRDLRFFESLDQQMRLFSSLDEKTALALLKHTLASWDHENDSHALLLEAWSRGDLETIHTLSNEGLSVAAPKAFETLITRRNEAWAQRIKTVLSGQGRSLIVVGAAHLAGPDSMIERLTAEGFEVVRIGGLDGAASAPALDGVEPEND